nr:MFS transporter [Flexivirga meconopsidis]
MVTLGWVAGTNASPFVYGVIMTLGTLPALGLFLFGGIASDRFGAGKVLIATSLARLLIATGWLAFAVQPAPSQTATLLVVTVIGVLADATMGYHDPARESYITVLSGSQRLVAAANDAERLVVRVGQTAGSVTAGFLLGAADDQRWVTAACWAGGCLATFGIFTRVRRLAPEPPPMQAESRPSLREGLAVLKGEHTLIRTYPLQSVASMAGGGAITVGGVLLVQRNGWPASTYGFAMAGYLGGLFVGARLGVWIRERGTRAPIAVAVLGSAVAACLQIVAALVPFAWVFVVCCAMSGVSTGPMGPLLTGYAKLRAKIRQETGGDVVAGRLLAPLYFGLNLEPAGYLVVAGSAAIASPSAGIVLLAVLTLLLVVRALASPHVRAAQLPAA